MEQAQRLHRDQHAIFIDAREPERFAAGHIAEALNLPLYQQEVWSGALETIAKEAMLVAYCDDDCDSARRLAEALRAAGYTKVFVMDRGYESWRKQGFPTAQTRP
jgi:rhodanese-related sulfurtransferase